MTAVDLLLITFNRSAYLKKTLQALLSDSADFRIYWWDNASTDETREIIATANDPRIVAKHFHDRNVGQQEPVRWFLSTATSDVVGKIDDDILLPAGWTQRIAPIVRSNAQIGMLGCWIFMPEDWDEQAASLNTITVNGHQILRVTSVAGHSFLARRSVMQDYLMAETTDHGIPIDRTKMALDGIISGIPTPPLFAHNMDDPRSDECKFKIGADDPQSALTGRCHGFKSAEDYAAWIARDARTRLTVRYETQLLRLRIQLRSGLIGRVQRRMLRVRDSLAKTFFASNS